MDACRMFDSGCHPAVSSLSSDSSACAAVDDVVSSPFAFREVHRFVASATGTNDAPGELVARGDSAAHGWYRLAIVK